MHFVKVVFILFYFVATLRSMELSCSYEDLADGYNCRAKNVITNQMNQIVTIENGIHIPDYGNINVEIFYVHTENKFEYLPVGLNNIYPNLIKLNVEYTSLKIINISDFIGLTGIKTIHFNDNQIQSFPGDTFSTLVKLEYISLKNNSIEILASNTFENLKNLEQVYFQNNQIQYLDSLLFKNNDKLQSISFNGNRLVNIGSELIKHWNQIKLIQFLSNICINNSYTSSLADRKLFQQNVTKCTEPVVTLTIVSYKILKEYKTTLEKTKSEFEDYKKKENSKGIEPEPNDDRISNKVLVVGYFFKTVLEHKQIVYTSVVFNLILIVIMIIRCLHKKNVTQIIDTTLILQRKHTITSRNSLI